MKYQQTNNLYLFITILWILQSGFGLCGKEV